jgi:hypothetical protein
MLSEKISAIILAITIALSGVSFNTSGDSVKRLPLPVIDGSKASEILNAAFASGYTGNDYETVLKNTAHSGNDIAFDRLISGEVDIVMTTAGIYVGVAEKIEENNFEYEEEIVASAIIERDLYPSPESYGGFKYFRIYYDKNTKKQNVIEYIKYMLSDEGQASVFLCGYEPIADLKLPLKEKPPYETLGTGEPRPVDFEKSREYSNITFAYGNYAVDDYKNMKYFLLDGDLTNSALEAEINEWIEKEINEKNLLERYSYVGVYCNGINGYLEVGITIAYFEEDNYMPDSPVSIWNLKTGERVTRFSDLFYEGTDFLPALKNAYKQPFYSPFINLETEPERFFITDFLVGDLAYDHIQNWFNTETEEDFYKQPISSMTSVMDLTPVWTYYDMTPHFSEEHLDEFNGWGNLRTDKIPEFSLVGKRYEKMCEWRVYSSRFLLEEEIKTRNNDLDKIYKYIENSDEFIKYNDEYKDEYFPIYTQVDFSEDGKFVTVITPFKNYCMDRESAKLLTSDNDIRLSENEDFFGVVDFNFDGTPEWISINDSINIYDNNLKPIFELPFNGKEYFEFQKWQVVKNTESGVIGGIIYYYSSGKYTAVLYEIDGGEIKVTGNKTYERESLREERNQFDFSLENMQTVVYTPFALSASMTDMLSRKTENAYNNFSEILKKISNKPFCAIAFEDYNAAFFTKENVKMGDKDITPNGYNADKLYYLIDGDVPVMVTRTKNEESPVTIMEYADGEVKESSVSQKVYDFGYAYRTKYSYSAKVPANDRYEINGETPVSRFTATTKEYWFNTNYGRITEYGGVSVTIDVLKNKPQGRNAIAAIEKENGEITSILYRDNGIININYNVRSKDNHEIIFHYYRTYYYEYNNIYEPSSMIFIEKGKGVYLPSYTESIGIVGMNEFNYGMPFSLVYEE